MHYAPDTDPDDPSRHTMTFRNWFDIFYKIRLLRETYWSSRTRVVFAALKWEIPKFPYHKFILFNMKEDVKEPVQAKFEGICFSASRASAPYAE